MADEPWWRDGLCAQIGPDLFFVGKHEPITDAKRVCQMCPVRVQCLADSLLSDVEHGVFGGFARPVRRALAIQVDFGADPTAVAIRAIAKEKKTRRRAQWQR